MFHCIIHDTSYDGRVCPACRLESDLIEMKTRMLHAYTLLLAFYNKSGRPSEVHDILYSLILE